MSFRPWYADFDNGDRLRLWGPLPAVETTFDGVHYVLDADAQHSAVTLVNRRMWRHNDSAKIHAQATLWLAANLDVNTYLASLVAEWVAPNHCGIDYERRVRILSREEEHAWCDAKLNRRHQAEIRANGGVCTTWAHQNNRACPTPKARLRLATVVRDRFGPSAAVIGHSRYEDGQVSLWDVQTRDGRVLWHAMNDGVVAWPAFADAVPLLHQCQYAATETGHGLLFALEGTA